jgi:septum formation protein
MLLILASASPRRADLLKAAGFAFEVIATSVDERVRRGEPPADYVMRVAAEKSARAVQQFLARAAPSAPASGPGDADPVVLAADTAVIVDGEILGKPEGEAHAVAMLRRLAGRTHEVMTGISVRTRTEESHHLETTTVTVAPMTEDEVHWYVGTGEGRDKAGGYAVQGLASRFVTRIDGSYTSVVGLPVAAVYAILERYRSRKSL